MQNPHQNLSGWRNLRSFALLAGAFFLCLAAAACSDEGEPQPSAADTVVDVPEDGAEDGTEDSADSAVDDSDSDTSADVENDQQGPPEDDQSSAPRTDDSNESDDTTGDAQDPTQDDTEDDAQDREAVGGPNNPALFLPPATAVSGSTASGYETIAELIADRTARPPLLRCAATEDPSSLAIGTGGQAAGRVYDYEDGLRTTTVQIWTYPTEADAANAIRSIRDLRCESTQIGPITIGAVVYEQSDSAREAPSQLGFAGVAGDSVSRGGVDEATGASFERFLESADGSLIVQEELQFARLGSTVVFAGAREIRSPDVDPFPPVADSLRLARQTITAVADSLGRDLAIGDGFSSPATLVPGGDISAGTFRATTTSFCLVSIEPADGQSAQISWGAGEQAIVTIADTTNAIFGDGCGIWTAIDLEDPALLSTLPAEGNGTLIVGTDVPPGTVVVTSTGECTIDQLAGFSGAPVDLVASTILPPGESIELAITTEVGVYLAAGCRY